MSEQPALFGPVAVPPDVKLTARQRLALEQIAAHGPVASDELGAYLHEYRRDTGGRGHDRDLRCTFCASDGRSVGKALRRKSLVRYRRGAGWYVPGETEPADEQPGAQQTGDDVDWGGFGE